MHNILNVFNTVILFHSVDFIYLYSHLSVVSDNNYPHLKLIFSVHRCDSHIVKSVTVVVSVGSLLHFLSARGTS